MKNNSFNIVKNGEIERLQYFSEHWYVTPDGTFPSATKVIGDVLAKGYGFEKWLKDKGEDSDIIRDSAAESGSKLHDAIEHMLKGETITAEHGDFDKFEWKKLNDFVNWHNEVKPRTIATEFMVYDKDIRVAGTVDWLCEINGEIWLIDFKTGNSTPDSGDLQVGGAYFNIYNKNPLFEVKADKAAILHIGAKNKKGIKLKDPMDTQTLGTQFKNIVDIFNWRFPNAKAPSLEYPLSLKL